MHTRWVPTSIALLPRNFHWALRVCWAQCKVPYYFLLLPNLSHNREVGIKVIINVKMRKQRRREVHAEIKGVKITEPVARTSPSSHSFLPCGVGHFGFEPLAPPLTPVSNSNWFKPTMKACPSCTVIGSDQPDVANQCRAYPLANHIGVADFWHCF